MVKLKTKIIFLSVLIFTALCAAISAFTIPALSASAATTPIYTLTYDYKYYQKNTWGSVRGEKTGVSTNYKDIVINFWGDSHSSDTKTLSASDNYFSFTTVNISAKRITNYTHISELYLYNSSNSELANDKHNNYTIQKFPTLNISKSLSQGTYTILGKYHNSASGGTGWTSWIEFSTNFTIDTTAPTISISCGDNGFSKGAVTVNYADNYAVASAVYSRSTNGTYPTSATTSFSNGASFTDEGNYTVKVTDKAGNVTTKHFTIDKTAPTLSLSGVSNGGFTNGSVSFTWNTGYTYVTSNRANTNDALTVKYSYSTTGSFPTTASTTYTSGTSLTTAGNYRVTITDKAGNSTSYTFTIDKSAPTLTLSGVSNGGFTNGNVTASWETTADSITAQRSNSNDALTVKYSYNTTGDFPTTASTAYSLNTPLLEAGNYRMTITDKAGNSKSYTFTIDKFAPVLSISTTDNGFFVDNRTKSNVTASWGTTANSVAAQRSNSNDALRIKYAYNETGNFPTTANTTFSSGTVFNTEGKYLLSISDKAGNISTYKFEIYRKPPTFSILSESGAELHSAYNAFNINIKIIFGNTITARLNSHNYVSGSLITEEGEYSVTLTDELGNRSTETVYIIKTPPTANFDVLKTSINRWYETTNTAGQTLAFASYDNAYSIADERERSLITTGIWTLTTWDGGINIAPEDL